MAILKVGSLWRLETGGAILFCGDRCGSGVGGQNTTLPTGSLIVILEDVNEYGRAKVCSACGTTGWMNDSWFCNSSGCAWEV